MSPQNIFFLCTIIIAIFLTTTSVCIYQWHYDIL
jgi:hypothetical protein